MIGGTLRRAARDLGIGAVSLFRGPGQGKRVIAFHDIADMRAFRERMKWLRDEYDVVSLEALVSPARRCRTEVAITFDDGYASWEEVAAPVLAELNIPAVFFVTTGLIGLTGERARRFARERLGRVQRVRFLTWRQLEQIAGHPLFEVGSHTVSHVNLGCAWDEARLGLELDGSRRQLEEQLGKAVRWFAYPFGEPTNVASGITERVRRAGFAAAFTLVPGFWRGEKGRFCGNRDGLDVGWARWLWAAWLGGAYDRLYALKVRALRHGMGASA